jgi:hypothetical protein
LRLANGLTRFVAVQAKKKPRMLSPLIKTYMPEQGVRGVDEEQHALKVGTRAYDSGVLFLGSYNSNQRAEDDQLDSDFGVGVISAISEVGELLQ